MKTIFERAKEYAEKRYPNYGTDRFVCETHFKDGAASERGALTRWRDPREELPEPRTYVLVKRTNGNYAVCFYEPDTGCFHVDDDTMYTCIAAWREIHEL